MRRSRRLSVAASMSAFLVEARGHIVGTPASGGHQGGEFCPMAREVPRHADTGGGAAEALPQTSGARGRLNTICQAEDRVGIRRALSDTRAPS